MARVILATPLSSAGARVLRENSGVLRVVPERVHLNSASVVVNWGNSGLVHRNNQTIFNAPQAVSIAQNKLSCLQALLDAAVPTLEFDTDFDRLRGRFPGQRVLARTTVTGSGGTGIEIIEPNEEPSQAVRKAPLFTLYFPKTVEMRVHVWGTEAIAVQQKLRRNLEEGGALRTTFQRVVRNWDNGWVFTSNIRDAEPSRVARTADIAIQAVMNCGLDFGAVDVLLSPDRAVVCEVNTRPGIESPPVIEAYTQQLRKLL